MIDLGRVFRRISDALEASETPYMLTGSFASSFYEALRATHDIDFVIAPNLEQLRRLVQYLRANNYYADLDAAISAFREPSMFNAFDDETGWKIDFIFCKSRPFSQTEFRRRTSTTIEGVPLFVATAEDVILAKLEWAKIGESHRQIEDAAKVMEKQNEKLDWPYLQHWTSELGVAAQYENARRLSAQR